jgi:single-strand DNA-binding protein
MLNMAVIIGSLAKPVDIRPLPSGTSVVSFDLQVLRTDLSPDTVPITLSEMEETSTDWPVGEQLIVIGRVRRRFFRVGGSTQSRTEVVAEKVIALRREGAVKVLAEAGSKLGLVIDDLSQATPGQVEELRIY